MIHEKKGRVKFDSAFIQNQISYFRCHNSQVEMYSCSRTKTVIISSNTQL